MVERNFMSRFALRLALPLAAAAFMAACASPRHDAPNRTVSNAPSVAGAQYGQVRSIETLGIPQDQPQGAGAVVGGVVGAVIGRQYGNSNSGKNVGTAVGAVTGAVIGNEIEKSARREHSGVRIAVTLDSGALRNFDYKSPGNLRVGDRVRIEGEQIYRL
jgi:outer membrane lipoprotein SlyB